MILRYLDRGGASEIIATYARPQYMGQESLPSDDPEVVAFEANSFPVPPVGVPATGQGDAVAVLNQLVAQLKEEAVIQ